MRPGAASGCRVGAHSGSGCGIAGLVPTAAASWDDAADCWPTQKTDRAMAARSVRTSSSEEESRSTDEEDRLLTKRCIGWHRANTCYTVWDLEKAKYRKHLPAKTVTSFFFLETNLSHDGPRRSRSNVISTSQFGRGALRCKKRGVKRHTAPAVQKKTKPACSGIGESVVIASWL